MSQTIIELNRLTKRYGDFTAVNQLTLQIRQGEIFGLLGPNGAGKSTTILMLLGMTEPTSGTARVCGIDSTRQPILVKQRVGYLPDDIGFYDDMTGFENLLYTAQLNRIPRKEATEKIYSLLDRIGLSYAAEKKTRTYSRGMRQRLGLADVLIKNPEVIIFDEPTLGIDPEGVRDFLELIRTLSKQERITVLLSSHHLHQVQQVCDRVGIFVQGELIAVGNLAELSKTLFAKEPVLIEARTSPLSDGILQELRNFPGVGAVQMESDMLLIGSTQDITAELAKWLIEKGVSLYHIGKKQYGLDEIYHRYFEGGATNDKSTAKKR
jgi:ABC-2 type transport system ATP-binding protein